MKTLLLPLAAALAFSSCGPNSYTREFVKASAALPRPPANAEGPWLGTWKSKVNGHTGPLWCIVKPNPDRPGHYDFRYRAGWGVFQFGDYTHTTPAKLADDGSIALSGEMKLPGGFGTYQVEGKLTRETFTTTYQGAGDRGIMTLKRPAP
ncbi:MAG: hypothetical protein V4819_19960 [Verrucomicrobiota bacterium]